MSIMNGDLRDFIQAAKRWIEQGDLLVLQESLKDLDSDVDWPTLFHRLYLHACLKKQVAIAEWMEKTVFPTLCPVQQIALRQIFPYGRHLLRKK